MPSLNPPLLEEIKNQCAKMDITYGYKDIYLQEENFKLKSYINVIFGRFLDEGLNPSTSTNSSRATLNHQLKLIVVGVKCKKPPSHGYYGNKSIEKWSSYNKYDTTIDLDDI